jgi:hypothetical protein
MQTSFAMRFPVYTLKCTLIGHVGFQPLTTDSRSNLTPEGFEPLTKSSRSNSPTNCTLCQRGDGVTETFKEVGHQVECLVMLGDDGDLSVG